MNFLNLSLVISVVCHCIVFSACSVGEMDSPPRDGGHEDVRGGGCKELQPFYRDFDRDSFGAGEAVMACENPSPEVYSSRGGDCNDRDDAIYPGALEICDGRHNNCNELDAPDGRDEEPLLASRQEGVCEGLRQVCREGKWVEEYTSVPGYGEEICDGLDNDCNPLTEDGRREEAPLADSQEGVCEGLHKVCQEGRWINNYERTPSYGPETCDEKDNNCDGKVDEGDVCGPICIDRDGDGYGFNCEKGLDCNDSNAAVYSLIYCNYDGNSCGNYNLCTEKCQTVPREICDGKDNNCDGEKDEGCSCIGNEEKRCGTTDKGECEYGKQTCAGGIWGECKGNIEPAAESCDYKDNDCDGVVDNNGVKKIYFKDEDEDGLGNPGGLIEDCAAPPGYVENNLDCDDGAASCGADCQSLKFQDKDKDRYGDPEASHRACDAPEGYVEDKTDCDDSEALKNPGAEEICDGLDNNCDGKIDEDFNVGLVCDGLDTDFCKNGTFTCRLDGDNVECVNETIKDIKEICDRIDNDCNGKVDEEDAQNCIIYYYDADNDTYGKDGNTKCLCSPSGFYKATRGNDCNDNDNTIRPGAIEICNSKDDDCNNQIDGENAIGCRIFYKDADNDNYGLNSDKKCLCSAVDSYKSTMGGDCDDQNKNINPSAVEVCDKKDNNCNGKTDEDLIDDTVVAYYPLDGDGTDKSASHNDGTATTKVTSVEGAFGPTSVGMHFEAACCSSGCSEGRIVAPNNPLLNFGGKSFTIMLWMKHKPVGDITCGYADLAFTYRNDVGHRDLGIMIYMLDEEYPNYAGKPFMWLYREHGEQCGWPVAGKRADDGQWHHVAFVREGSRTVYAYIDGGLTATIDLGIDCVIASDMAPPVTVGGGHLTGGASWNGELDELLIFSRALTGNEVKTYYNTGSFCKP